MRVRQAVSINAPVDQAFAYLDDPENSLALISSLVEVREIAPLANRGHRLRFVALGRGGKQPMRKQLRSLLSVVRGRIEAASLQPS